MPDWKAEPAAVPIDPVMAWGSDVPASVLRRLEIDYISLTPGASYRGLHDSLVNHLGNTQPEILLCLHEEHSVSIAHGYAKATGRPMAVALHSNVGLMHGSMAIFNAFADRAPMLILGATGPMDATERRPWIDWLHTSQDQAALVRNFLKWDDQPGSVAAIPEAMLRGWKMTQTEPKGPVYINLDAGDQESPLAVPIGIPEPSRYAPPAPAGPNGTSAKKAAARLKSAKQPVILFGRGARTKEAQDNRIALAERLGAAMLSDLKAGAMVPTDHPLHVGTPFNKVSAAARQVLRSADVILSLGWIDLGGLMKQAFGMETPEKTVIHAGLDTQLHRGWGQEHFGLPPVDIDLNCSSDAAVETLLAQIPKGQKHYDIEEVPTALPEESKGTLLTNRDIARSLKASVGDIPVTFAALARGWPVDLWPHRHPLDYLGKDGGGGIGSGPGITIGAALALKGSGRLVVGSLGDGDTLMGINALWTAAKYRIPALFLISNNRSYFNDELHQENVARQRNRNPDNAWIGQRLDDPAPDLVSLASGQGVEGRGPITNLCDLEDAMKDAVAALQSNLPYLIDVHIDPRQGREAAVPRSGAGT